MPDKAHLHWIVWAYDHLDAEGQCVDNVTLDLLAETQGQALERAAALVPGRKYRINSVIEHRDRGCKG